VAQSTQPPSSYDTTVTELVTDWLSLEEVAERLGTTVGRVRRHLREGDLVGLTVPDRKGPQVPALFVADGQVVKGLPGTLTLLTDARYRPDEAVAWLFTADESLPGRPIDALRDNRGTEVRRRAQALA
jgi:hypothetical protein